MSEPDSTLHGERTARDALDALRVTCGDGDELLRVMTRLIAQGDEGAVKALMRQLQKRLERARV